MDSVPSCYIVIVFIELAFSPRANIQSMRRSGFSKKAMESAFRPVAFVRSSPSIREQG